jgi:hypothetical protein
MIKKTIAAIAAAMLVSIGVAQSPAQAVIGCPAGALCLYDSNYSSAVPFWDIDGADFNPNGCVTLGLNDRNRTTYIWNRSPFKFTAYTGIGCAGTSGPIYANTQGNMTGVYYKTLDSFRRVG